MEKGYEWLRALQLYRQSASSFAGREAAGIHERTAYCSYRAAFQSESPEQFSQRMRDASSQYGGAAELYKTHGQDPRAHHSEAMSEFANFWISKDPSERINALDRSVERERVLLELGRRLGRVDLVVEACTTLLQVLYQRLELEFNTELRAKLAEDALQVSELGTGSLGPNDNRSMALLYLLSTPLHYFSCQILSDAKRRELSRNLAARYPEKALELAGGALDSFSLGMVHHWMSITKLEMGGDVDASLEHSTLAVNHFEAAADRYWVGFAAGYGGYIRGHWATLAEADPEVRELKAAECEKYAQLAISNGERIGNEFVLAWACYGIGELHNGKGRYSVFDRSEKIHSFQKALEANEKGLEYARISGSTSAIASAEHSLSKTYQFMAEIEADRDRKKKLLDQALRHRTDSIAVWEKSVPYNDWDLGVIGNYKTMVRSEMAKTELGKQEKISVLTEAVADAETCIEHFRRSYPVTSGASLGYLTHYARHSSNLGRILKQLYELDKDPKNLVRLASAFQFSAEIAVKAKNHVLAAELRWETAKSYDSAGEYLKASSEFKEAAVNYSQAIEEIPSLKGLYADLSNYLSTWSYVEEARSHHENERFLEASHSYGKASQRLNRTTRLTPLSAHYSACAFLEEGDMHSRNERPELARDSFAKAASLFSEAKNQLEKQLPRAASDEEKDEATKWLNVTLGREKYAVARATLEEGRVLDRKGEKLASSTKFAAAASMLEGLADEEETEKGRREVESLALFCRAWQKMKEAEAESSPELYGEASEMFIRAKKAAPRERLGLLAIGNASYCKALETGSRFRATHDIKLYTTAKQYLESAADYYTEAGFEQASNWTRATERMFDALIYLSTAETELDPEKKAKLYHLAEKNLEHAATLYDRSSYPTKKEEALRHLKRTQEEKELLLTPVDILKEAPILSSPSNISSPALTRDQPMGLERFDHASIEAHLMVRDRTLKVGDRVECEVEIVNAGRGPAALLKMEHIRPEGFTAEIRGEKYRLEDNHLNLRGRRLDPLKMEEVVLTLKAMKKGGFLFRPRILYLDEEGKHRYYEPEAVKLTVSEIGISGWIKGPSK